MALRRRLLVRPRARRGLAGRVGFGSAVATLIASEISRGLGSSGGNYQLASKGKVGTLLALATAALTGSAVALLNWLVRIGSRM